MKIYQALGILFTWLILAGNQPVQAQSGKKPDKHVTEMVKADAYAMGYITCKYQMLKYRRSQEQSDGLLKRQLKEAEILYTRFKIFSEVKYRGKPKLYEDFTRLAKLSREELSICIKYDNILETLEENQSQ